MFSTVSPRGFPMSRAAIARFSLLGALLTATSAHAAALADVQLIDRHSGQRLTLYQHQGEYWVAGRPGANYSIEVRNRSGRRIMAVISVDGVNVLTGRTASATPDDGYVYNPWQRWAISGWRKSDSQVAAFYFSESDASYASRTGRPRDVGVIGVALFRERRPEPPRIGPLNSRVAPSAGDSAEVSAEAPMSAPKAAPSAADIAPRQAEANQAARSERRASVSPGPSLGTGHGAMENSYTQRTEFIAATSQPEQVVRIRYDSYDNLVAMGVIREPRPDPRPSPNAFPADPVAGYVPDPPRW